MPKKRLTKTPSDVIPFKKDKDYDYITLAKMINLCPVGDYLKEHNPAQYAFILKTAQDLKEQEAADMIAAPLATVLFLFYGKLPNLSSIRPTKNPFGRINVCGGQCKSGGFHF